MRTGIHLAAFTVAAGMSLGVMAPAAGATSVKPPPPVTSAQVCTTYPAQFVAQEVGKKTKPSTTAYYSSKFTSADFEVICLYKFSATARLNLGFYGPAHPVAEAAGSKVPALGPTGRLLVSAPYTFVYVLSHGYDITVGGQTASFGHSALIAVALYATRHLP